MSGHIIHADVLDGLAEIDPGSVALICTSPPYADARAKHYGGPPPSEYCEWYSADRGRHEKGRCRRRLIRRKHKGTGPSTASARSTSTT